MTDLYVFSDKRPGLDFGYIERELEKLEYRKDKIEIVNAEEVITNHEEPVKAVRHKKDASVVVAANLLKDGAGDAMLSMGNTGAFAYGKGSQNAD